MLKVLYGEEPYGIEYFLNSEMKEMKIENDEIVRATMSTAILDDIYSFGLFGRKYFILSAPDLKSQVIETLLAKEPANEVRVVVDAIDKRTSVYSRLDKAQKLKVFSRLNENEFKKFVLGRLRGMKITQSDFDYLIERIGYISDEDVSLYTAEIWLKQLRSSCEVIDRRAIDYFIPMRIKENAFQLFSYFCASEREKFFSLLLELMLNGENEINLLSTLLYSFRLSYKVALVGKDRAQIDLRISPYQVKNAADIEPKESLRCINILTDGIRSIKGGCEPKNAVVVTAAKLFA